MNQFADLDHEHVARIGELVITAWQAGKSSSMASSADNALYLREWAADIRTHNGKSVDADRLDSIAGEIEHLRGMWIAAAMTPADVEWKHRENQDSDFAETAIGDLDVLAQDCDGDFSRWDVRRAGKYLAMGETYGRENRYHFDVAKEYATDVAHAILKAERLNEHVASPECANCGYPQYMHDAADRCDGFRSV